MRGRQVGQHALLIECDDSAQVGATYAHLRARAGQLGATDVVPAARTVLLDGLADPRAVLDQLAGEVASGGQPGPAAPDAVPVEVPTTYDGADLDEVARQWDVTAAEVVRIHQGSTFQVLFCGFAPGFAYCTGLPEGLVVRRRSDPRPAVPPGSVALAGEYTSVYPRSSPGGWQLIGSTGLRLWRPDQEQPALLAPGTRVRFVDA